MIYKYFLFVYFLAISFFMAFFYYNNLAIRQNYLYLGQSKLKKHEISYAAPSINKIIFLGSSAVAGSNIPKDTTTSDFFNKLLVNHKSYNLAVLQASTIESLLILKMIEHKNPKIVILGINPASFPATVPGGDLIWQNFSLLDEYLTNDEKKEIRRNKYAKLGFNPLRGGAGAKILPTEHHIAIQTFLEKLRHLLFGNVFNTNMTGERGQSAVSALNTESMYYRSLDYVKSLAEKKGFKFYVYLEPIFDAEKVYGKQDFNMYLKTVTGYLNKLNVSYFDYTKLNPNTHDYFYDFIHMTPEGNKKVAMKLYKDIGGKL